MPIERLLILPIALSTVGVGNTLFGADSLSVAQLAAASTQRGLALPPAALISNRSADGLFWIPVSARSAQFRALIDTGASSSFINRTTLARLQSDHQATTVLRQAEQMFLTLTGRAHFQIVTLNQLHVGPYTVGPVEVAVLPSDGSPNVIGQDIIAKLGTIKIEGNQLSFH